jgi:hypothetical protein
MKNCSTHSKDWTSALVGQAGSLLADCQSAKRRFATGAQITELPHRAAKPQPKTFHEETWKQASR